MGAVEDIIGAESPDFIITSGDSFAQIICACRGEITFKDIIKGYHHNCQRRIDIVLSKVAQ